jgi:hypothetical protein
MDWLVLTVNFSVWTINLLEHMTQLTNGDGKDCIMLLERKPSKRTNISKSLIVINGWHFMTSSLLSVFISPIWWLPNLIGADHIQMKPRSLVGVCIHTLQLVKAVIGEQIQQVCGVELGCHKSMTVTTDPHRHCKTKQEE